MALRCSIQIHKDYAEVRALNDETLRTLKFDMSDTYCRIFETTKQQVRDYFEEIIRWAHGNKPENLENVIRSIMLNVCVKRRSIGMTR